MDEEDVQFTFAQEQELKQKIYEDNRRQAKDLVKHFLNKLDCNNSGKKEEELSQALAVAYNKALDCINKLSLTSNEVTERMCNKTQEIIECLAFLLIDKGPAEFNTAYENFLRDDTHEILHAPVGYAIRAMKEELGIEGGIRRRVKTRDRVPHYTLQQEQEIRQQMRVINAQQAEKLIGHFLDKIGINKSDKEEEQLSLALTIAYNKAYSFIYRSPVINDKAAEEMFDKSQEYIEALTFILIEKGQIAFNNAYEGFLRDDTKASLHIPVSRAIRAMKEELEIKGGIRSRTSAYSRREGTGSPTDYGVRRR